MLLQKLQNLIQSSVIKISEIVDNSYFQNKYTFLVFKTYVIEN